MPDEDVTTYAYELANEDVAIYEAAADLLAQEKIEDEDATENMLELMDISQTLGVAAEDTHVFASAVSKGKPRF